MNDTTNPFCPGVFEFKHLRMENHEGAVDFFYSINGKDWMKTMCSALVSSLNHNAYGGFLSLRLGLYATGEGTNLQEF